MKTLQQELKKMKNIKTPIPNVCAVCAKCNMVVNREKAVYTCLLCGAKIDYSL